MICDSMFPDIERSRNGTNLITNVRAFEQAQQNEHYLTKLATIN